MIKHCGKCNKDSEFTEVGKICISCKTKYDKEYNLKNAEKIRARVSEYNLLHKEDKKNYDRDYRITNQPKVKNWRNLRKASGKSYIDARKSFIKRKYKISLEDYDAILVSQDNKCKICGNTKSNHRNEILYIDHCHTTGKIRGLLCHHCNVGLGGFKDNIESLSKAIKYLEESRL